MGVSGRVFGLGSLVEWPGGVSSCSVNVLSVYTVRKYVCVSDTVCHFWDAAHYLDGS